MPSLSSSPLYLFELESIPVDGVLPYISRHDSTLKALDNEIGNHLLYKEVIPVSVEDLRVDLGLLKAVISTQPQKYYSKTFNKIIVSEDLLSRFPDISKLVVVFIDSLHPSEVTTVLLSSAHFGEKKLGTIISPEIKIKSGSVSLTVENKKYEMAVGSLLVVPAKGDRVDIKFESESAKLLGKNILENEVAGGEMGIMVDLRVDCKII